MTVRVFLLIVCLAVSLAALRGQSSAQDPGTGTGVNVTTWQYDIGRTGQNLNEGNPTVANHHVYVATQSDNVTTSGGGTFYIFGPGRSGC